MSKFTQFFKKTKDLPEEGLRVDQLMRSSSIIPNLSFKIVEKNFVFHITLTEKNIKDKNLNRNSYKDLAILTMLLEYGKNLGKKIVTKPEEMQLNQKAADDLQKLKVRLGESFLDSAVLEKNEELQRLIRRIQTNKFFISLVFDNCNLETLHFDKNDFLLSYQSINCEIYYKNINSIEFEGESNISFLPKPEYLEHLELLKLTPKNTIALHCRGQIPEKLISQDAIREAKQKYNTEKKINKDDNTDYSTILMEETQDLMKKEKKGGVAKELDNTFTRKDLSSEELEKILLDNAPYTKDGHKYTPFRDGPVTVTTQDFFTTPEYAEHIRKQSDKEKPFSSQKVLDKKEVQANPHSPSEDLPENHIPKKTKRQLPATPARSSVRGLLESSSQEKHDKNAIIIRISEENIDKSSGDLKQETLLSILSIIEQLEQDGSLDIIQEIDGEKVKIAASSISLVFDNCKHLKTLPIGKSGFFSPCVKSIEFIEKDGENAESGLEIMPQPEYFRHIEKLKLLPKDTILFNHFKQIPEKFVPTAVIDEAVSIYNKKNNSAFGNKSNYNFASNLIETAELTPISLRNDEYKKAKSNKKTFVPSEPSEDLPDKQIPAKTRRAFSATPAARSLDPSSAKDLKKAGLVSQYVQGKAEETTPASSVESFSALKTDSTKREGGVDIIDL